MTYELFDLSECEDRAERDATVAANCVMQLIDLPGDLRVTAQVPANRVGWELCVVDLGGNRVTDHYRLCDIAQFVAACDGFGGTFR